MRHTDEPRPRRYLKLNTLGNAVVLKNQMSPEQLSEAEALISNYSETGKNLTK